MSKLEYDGLQWVGVINNEEEFFRVSLIPLSPGNQISNFSCTTLFPTYLL